MSTISFFQASPIAGDPLHRELAKMPRYEARLQAIRREMLDCCGCETHEDGGLELVIINTEKQNKLAAEQAGILARQAALNELIESLDMIFSDAEKQGIHVHRKTVNGIRSTENQYRKARGVEFDDFGHPIPTPSEPRLLKLVQRAEASWKAYIEASEPDEVAHAQASPEATRLWGAWNGVRSMLSS